MPRSNEKGGNFERDMCRRFSLWYSKNQQVQVDDLYWRTSGSGSRATNRGRKGRGLTKYQHGDMGPDRPGGEKLVDFFSFEFKSYRGIDFHGIFHSVSPEKSLLSFWAKCVRDAEQSGRVPWLVTKVNNGRPIAWVPYSLLQFFAAAGQTVSYDRGLQFWVPAMEVVTQRTYARLRKKKGAKKKPKKATRGKGKPKNEKYVLPEPQHVFGVDLDAMLNCIRDPETLMAWFESWGLDTLPVPRRKDPTDAR